MLPPLHEAERRRAFRVAATLCALPVLLAPLAGRSSFEIRAEHAVLDRRLTPVRVAATPPGVPIVARDPFVPQAPGKVRIASTIGAQTPQARALVRAIVSGTAPRALIEEGGRVRIVAIGDILDTAKVLRIDESGVLLSNGTALTIEDPAL